MKIFRVQMRASVIAVGAVVSVLAGCGLSAHSPDNRAGALRSSAPSAANAPQPPTPENDGAELAKRLKTICDRAGGDVGVAVTHVETARTVAIQGATQVPLYSVFKLPLAVSVLKDVEENRLRLDQKVRITPAEVCRLAWNSTSGASPSSELRGVAERSSCERQTHRSTSSSVVGGPAAVTQRMRRSFPRIDIRYSFGRLRRARKPQYGHGLRPRAPARATSAGAGATAAAAHAASRINGANDDRVATLAG